MATVQIYHLCMLISTFSSAPKKLNFACINTKCINSAIIIIIVVSLTRVSKCTKLTRDPICTMDHGYTCSYPY